MEIELLINHVIEKEASETGPEIRYRQPLIAYTNADNPLFGQLKVLADPFHVLPSDILPGAQSVVAFFLPFEKYIVDSNLDHRKKPSALWSHAYIVTNQLIRQITGSLIETLSQHGIHAATVPPTHNFDPVTLSTPWSHKSAAVIAGLGSFGLHQMVITDSGCAGRFGSFVIDVKIPPTDFTKKERCRYFNNGTCQECVRSCPVRALSPEKPLDKQLCWKNLQANAKAYEKIASGVADVCGKCATGPCALSSGV